jgi:hypothetical protein
MTIVVTVLVVIAAVQAFLLLGVLRSHAAILRRLHDLGQGLDADAAGERPASDTSAPADLGLPRPGGQTSGRPAADLTGVDPYGDAVAIRVGEVEHDTVLLFLSSGCRTCHAFWEALGSDDLPGGGRAVIVTKGEESESPVAVAEVAPPGVPLVMSSDAWRDYQVPGSPYVVHVDGVTGTVRGEGTSADWAAARRMMVEAAGDLDARRSRKAAADVAREREVDRVLLDAGIEPGDQSLYPEPS